MGFLGNLVIVAVLALSATACTSAQIVPTDGPGQQPVLIASVERRSFDLGEQARVIARTCAQSVREGPAALRALGGQGYTLTRGLFGPQYTRVSPRVSMLNAGMYVSVRATNRGDCSVEVGKNVARAFLQGVNRELEALGFSRNDDRARNFTMGDVTIRTYALTSSTSITATVAIQGVR